MCEYTNYKKSLLWCMFTEVANNIWVDKETGNHICSDNYGLRKEQIDSLGDTEYFLKKCEETKSNHF